MKKIIYLIVLLIPFFGLSQTLVPEAHWIDGNHRDWCDKGIGTAFTSHNGTVTAFNYQGNGWLSGGHVYMYTINEALKTSQSDLNNIKMNDFKLGPSNNHNNKIEFNFPGESTSEDEGPVLGRAFFFQYLAQTWYSIHIGCAYDNQKSFECFARVPDNTDLKCFTYYNTLKYDVGLYYDVLNTSKQGAFQLDSLVYFLAYHWNSLNTYDTYWEIQEYRFDTTDSHFKSNENTRIYSSLTYPYLGGVIARLDSLNNMYFIATFYDQAGHWQVGKLIPGISDGKRTFYWELLIDNSHLNPFTSTIAATTLFDGTVKGNRVASDIPNKAQSDRLILFGECHDKSSDGYYHVQYGEYHFDNDLLFPDNKGEITLPSSSGPGKVSNYYNIHASYMLIPNDYQTVMSGIDGYQQYLWLLYPDHDRNFNGALFQSDFWCVSPAYKYSSDLDNAGKYPGISSLWTLAGIVDGAPPVSMNWHKWDSTWGYPVAATMMELESDSSGASEFTTQSENEWSVGLNVDVEGKRKQYLYHTSLGAKFKFSQMFEKTVSSSETHSVTYTTPFELEEESQEYGYFLYIVPIIKRYSFSAFPWWDDPKKQEYPEEGTFQYLFMTIGNKPISQPVPIGNPPFNISDPNGPDLYSWQGDGDRKFLLEQAGSYDLHPVMSLSWISPGNGSHMAIQTSLEAQQSDAQTKKWDFEVEAGYTEKIPDICKIDIQLSTGYSGSLMSETTSIAEYGKRIFASLEQLTSSHKGVNIDTLSMDGYLFTNDVNPDWWFYEGLNGEKPFYFAWVVSTVNKSVIPLTPANGSLVQPNELLFSWRTDHGTLENYELVISKSTPIAKTNIIYRINTGDATDASTADFIPEPGTTYYWSVKGYDEKGKKIFSPVSSFTIPKEEDQKEQINRISTVVTSNPGTKNDIRIMVSPAADGPVTLSLRNLSGTEVHRQSFKGTGNRIVYFSLGGTNLAPGLYFAVIESDGERVVKKIIIQ